jgi:hypothetical protein
LGRPKSARFDVAILDDSDLLGLDDVLRVWSGGSPRPGSPATMSQTNPTSPGDLNALNKEVREITAFINKLIQIAHLIQ